MSESLSGSADLRLQSEGSGVSECVGAHRGCGSVGSGCIDERAVLGWIWLEAGESL